MTLIVSLHTPDGIVIAGDSLASMSSQMNFQADVSVKCPSCGHDHIVPISIPIPPVAATTFSYAQKIFPCLKKYGIGTFGAGMLLGKSIYYIVREFEQSLSKASSKQRVKGVSDLARELGAYVHEILKQQFQLEGVDLNQLQDKQVVIGFQVAGYDNGDPKTFQVHIGKTVEIITNQDKAGCVINGQPQVSQALWTLYSDRQQSPAFEAFSLQDAISYAEFLIKTTALHQQFSRTMPNVGGDIDIALVTPFNDFRWIRQKPLAKLLEEPK